MKTKPDKYPTCPPDEPNRFAWIVRTAAQMRRQQAHAMDLAHTRLAAQRRAALQVVSDAEAADVARRTGKASLGR